MIHYVIPFILGLFLLLHPILGDDIQPSVTTQSTTQPQFKFNPTLITLHYNAAPAKEVLEALGQAANVHFIFRDVQLWTSGPRVTIDVTDQPFWPTMLEVCRQAQVDFSSYDVTTSRTLTLRPNAPCQFVQLSTSKTGKWMVLLFQISRRSRLVFDGSLSNAGSIAYQQLILIDPAYTVIPGAIVTSLSSIKDENNTDIRAPENIQFSQSSWGASTLICGTQFDFPHAKNVGNRISEMVGSIQIPISKREEKWEVNNLTPGFTQTKTIGGRTYLMKFTTDNANDTPIYELKITLGKDRSYRYQDTPSISTGGIAQTIEYYLANGNHCTDYTSFSVGDSEYYRRFSIPPSRLVWNVPAEYETVTVPFTFRDLPIP